MKLISKKHKLIRMFFMSLLLFLIQGTKSQSLTFSTTTNSQCFSPAPGNTVNAYVTTTPTNATSYTWNVSNTSGSCTPNYTISPINGSLVAIEYPCCGVYSITCIAMNGSTIITSTNSTFTISCLPTISFAGSTSLCAGSNGTLYANGAQSYTWSNAVTGSVNVISPTVSTTYSVLASGWINGCMNSASVSVNVIQPTLANYTYSLLTNGQVSFSNTSTNTSSSTTYFWNFGNGSTSTSVSPSVTYTNNGIYTVTLSANSSCGSNFAIQTITVSSLPNPTCTPSFTYASNSNGSFTFTSTTPSASSLTTYSWNFGNSSPNFVATGTSGIVPPSQTYTAATFTVSLKITNSNPFCTDSVSVIIANCMIQPNFSSILTSSNTVSFMSTSSGTPASSTFLWNFGDGTNGSGPNPSHTYTSSGTYSVTLTVSNTSTCTSTITKIVVINACSLVSNFTHTALTNGVVNFSSSSSTLTGASTYYWDFGDGVYSTNNSPSHTYANAGTYYVKLKIKDIISTCSDSVIQSINVTGINCVANANFSVAASTTPQYWIVTPSYPYNITSATWFWGDGTQSNSLYASHLYTVAGNYSICLTVTASCGANSYYCHSYHLNKSSDIASQIIHINVEAPPITNSIVEKTLDDLSLLIYPNPNNSEFSILLNETNKEFNLSVYNLTGDLVYSQKIHYKGEAEKVRMNQMPNGIYFVKLSSGSQILTRKIVISQ